jgi:hypothetical protein
MVVLFVGAESRQFGRALYELNIDGICANTPAAKLSRQLKNVIVWIIFNVQSHRQCASQLLQLCQ